LIGELLYFVYQAVGALFFASSAMWLAFVMALSLINTIVSLAQPPDRRETNGL